MVDAAAYFMSHALLAAHKARHLPRGRHRDKQRTVARICHLLAKAAVAADRETSQGSGSVAVATHGHMRAL
jgi:hypothetical protein